MMENLNWWDVHERKMRGNMRDIFSIFFCGCKQFKSVHTIIFERKDRK